jgi:hypothetical protein
MSQQTSKGLLIKPTHIADLINTFNNGNSSNSHKQLMPEETIKIGNPFGGSMGMPSVCAALSRFLQASIAM